MQSGASEHLVKGMRMRRPTVNVHLAPTPLSARPDTDEFPSLPTGQASARETERMIQEEETKLVHRVFLGTAAEQPKMVVFAGIDRGNGCSRICRRTAELLARISSGSVCLVEAAIRSKAPCDGANSLSLGRVGSSPPDTSVRTYIHPLETANLWTAPREALTSSSDELGFDGLRDRIEQLRKEFDRIVVAAPPLNLGGEAVALAQVSDGLVLIVEAEATRPQTAQHVIRNLREAGVKVLGAVLNNRTFPIPEKLYRRL